MVDFFELEKRCKKLQQKRILKVSGIVSLVGGGFFLIYNLFSTSPSSSPKVHKVNKAVIHKVEKKEVKKVEKVEKVEKKPIKEIKKIGQDKKVVHKEVLKEEQNSSLKIKQKVEKKSNEGNVTKKEIIKKENNKTTSLSNLKTFQTPPMLEVKIDLNNLKDKENYLKKRKHITHKEDKKSSKIVKTEKLTFKKALNLAQLYYTNGDYKNSIKWCKLASKIDNKAESVWKLYALNLEKIGEKDKAIIILKTYLRYKNSLELKFLLERLEE